MLGGIVQGKLATLRTPGDEDLAFVNALMADLRVRREGHLWGEPATPEVWRERLRSTAKSEREIAWIVDSGGRPAGVVRVETGHEEPRHVDVVQLAIDPALWGRGLGSDAAIALHRYLFDYLDKRGCAADLAADNERGLRLAAKLGYLEFGRGHEVYFRDGAYADQVWLRCDREEWDRRFPSEREYAPLREGIER